MMAQFVIIFCVFHLQIDDYSAEIEGLQKLLTEKTNEVKLVSFYKVMG